MASQARGRGTVTALQHGVTDSTSLATRKPGVCVPAPRPCCVAPGEVVPLLSLVVPHDVTRDPPPSSQPVCGRGHCPVTERENRAPGVISDLQHSGWVSESSPVCPLQTSYPCALSGSPDSHNPGAPPRVWSAWLVPATFGKLMSGVSRPPKYAWCQQRKCFDFTIQWQCEGMLARHPRVPKEAGIAPGCWWILDRPAHLTPHAPSPASSEATTVPGCRPRRLH